MYNFFFSIRVQNYTKVSKHARKSSILAFFLKKIKTPLPNVNTLS